MLREVLKTFKETPRRIPSKYFYDEVGSKLFDEICDLDEYYPTRTEMKILMDNISEITESFPEDVVMIEFGSGSSLKTKILLKNIMHLNAYVPVDISEDHLYASVDTLKKEFPQFNIKPLPADYTRPFVVPSFSEKDNRLIFFPGSTIGNFTRDESKEFLRIMREMSGRNGHLLIGIDLVKEREVLLRAYNDSKGVTALFNLNILKVLNKTLNADFDINGYMHEAVYNETEQRIEMHLISTKSQRVNIDDESFDIAEGERIVTEYSHKYEIEKFEELAEGSFRLDNYWTDDKRYFAVLLMRAV